MGHTHYWGSKGLIDATAYQNALFDIKAVLQDREVAEIVAGLDGTGKPDTQRGIAFNGREDRGADFEGFFLPADPASIRDFEFCKTGERPYDVVVVAALAVLAEVSGLKVSSDGRESDWETGVALASKVLGRSVRNPIVRLATQTNRR